MTTGKLTTNIVAAGIYRFEDGVATVLDGKLQTAVSKLCLRRRDGRFSFQDNYRARKIRQGSDDEPGCLQPGSLADDSRCQLQSGFTTRRFLPLWNRSILAVRSPHRLFHLYPSQQLPLSLRLPLLQERRRPCRELQGQFIFEWVIRRWWDESGSVIQSGEQWQYGQQWW